MAGGRQLVEAAAARQAIGVDPGAAAGDFEQVVEVGSEAVAEVDHGGGAVAGRGQAGGQAGFGCQVVLERGPGDGIGECQP